jgi:radical SAM superfamily enzyme YgiQ (UPF0313 family)
VFAEESKGLVKIEIGEKRISLSMDSDMIYYSLADRTYRRTKMNDFIEFRHISGNRSARLLDESEKISVASSFYEDIKSASSEYPFLKKYIKNYDFLVKRSETLMSIYGNRIPIVPPDRYFSLYVRVSRGCPWNRCTFCNLYKDLEYMPLGFSELKSQTRELREYFGNSLDSMTGIFLGDANAISLNSSILSGYMSYLKKKFNLPFYAFSDAFTTPMKNTDFVMLKEMGLKRIYVGIESGNPGILKMLNKKMDLNRARGFIEEIKKAGIGLGLIVMSGFGGAHARDTVNFLKSVNYSRGDIIYISPVKEYNGFHEILMANGLYETEKAGIKEYEKIRDSLRESLEIPVVVYSLDESLY